MADDDKVMQSEDAGMIPAPDQQEAVTGEVVVQEQEVQTHSKLVEYRTVEDVMEDSYLRYSMSVIVSRALPDVRDGM